MTGAASGGEPTLDRRQFLRLAALGAGALAISPALEACSRSSVSVPVSLRAAAREAARRSKPGLNLFPGAGELLSGRQQRFPFGLTDPAGNSILGPQARVWIGQGNASTGPYTVALERYRRLEQADDPQGFYVATMPMPSNGLAWVMAEARGLYGFTPVQAVDAPTTPGIGQRAIPVETPTVGQPRGVTNICTRKPPCPLHTVTLADALRARKPVVFTIASPLLCTSRTCGPVLDEVLDVRMSVGARAIFVHAEPYKGN
ncbi:MAG: twin-arginine translocation signal domain-containing protein, partial [Actinomycetota bacterium]